jgi:hypothetical protein
MCALLFLFLNSQVESAELRKSREPISDLSLAQIVLVEIHQLAPQALVVPSSVEKIVTERMEELKYTVETDTFSSHDVVVQVMCGERETDPFNGPPCLFQFRFQGTLMPWIQVERVIFSEGVNTAKQLASRNPTAGPTSLTLSYLKEFEFPLLLSAEWGQVDRLLQTFRSPTTSLSRKAMIMVLLGEIQAEPAFKVLADALEDESLRPGAARALGEFGERARPYLTSLLKTSTRPDVQAAAVHGLGRVGAMTGDTSSTSLLLQILKAPGVNRRVQTEVVWALGKAPDFRAFPALAELEQTIWMIRSNDPELEKLRQAVDWSIREVRQGGHTDDY